MQVNLTADHRVVYGADGALFLKDLADLIEKRPESLAL
jgi:pyruvate dehydrogenase E2 component (dihydrolipoamide acetyltransferase)